MENNNEVTSRTPTGEEIKQMIKDRSLRIKRETTVVKHNSEKTVIDYIDDESNVEKTDEIE